MADDKKPSTTPATQNDAPAASPATPPAESQSGPPKPAKPVKPRPFGVVSNRKK